MYMYICIYVYMYICIYVYMYINICVLRHPFYAAQCGCGLRDYRCRLRVIVQAFRELR